VAASLEAETEQNKECNECIENTWMKVKGSKDLAAFHKACPTCKEALTQEDAMVVANMKFEEQADDVEQESEEEEDEEQKPSLKGKCGQCFKKHWRDVAKSVNGRGKKALVQGEKALEAKCKSACADKGSSLLEGEVELSEDEVAEIESFLDELGGEDAEEEDEEDEEEAEESEEDAVQETEEEEGQEEQLSEPCQACLQQNEEKASKLAEECETKHKDDAEQMEQCRNTAMLQLIDACKVACEKDGQSGKSLLQHLEDQDEDGQEEEDGEEEESENQEDEQGEETEGEEPEGEETEDAEQDADSEEQASEDEQTETAEESDASVFLQNQPVTLEEGEQASVEDTELPKWNWLFLPKKCKKCMKAAWHAAKKTMKASFKKAKAGCKGKKSCIKGLKADFVKKGHALFAAKCKGMCPASLLITEVDLGEGDDDLTDDEAEGSAFLYEVADEDDLEEDEEDETAEAEESQESQQEVQEDKSV
jgi:hypothetical protein